MAGVAVNEMEIFRKYGLEVEQVEPSVYKICNTDREVNISRLQWDLKQCSMFISAQKRIKHMPDGYAEYYSNVYYVITDGKYELVGKYEDILQGNFALLCYDYRDYLEPCMSTLYGKEEIENYGAF